MPVVAYVASFVVSNAYALSVLAMGLIGEAYVNYSKFSHLYESDDDFHSAVETYETDKKEAIETEANDAITAHTDFIEAEAPVVETIQDPVTVNPITMPDYLAQQNELLQMQIQATKNLTAQSKFHNDLLSKSIQSQIVSNANSKMVAETLASSLPALVMQMQQVSKIPATMKIKSEIETTQHEEKMKAIKDDREFQAIYAADYVNAISELKYSLSTTQQQTANATAVVANNLQATSELAKAQTTVARITDLDGNVVAELKPWELSTYKDLTLAKAKEKEKEIGDYKTGYGEITNLDGTVIASVGTPLQMETIKHATDAKNATDEMEFEMPDDILDHLFKPFPLPAFTNYDYNKQNEFMFNGGSL